MTNWTVWKKEKHYQKLFWSGAINGIGNRFSQVAILTLLYQITGAGMAIGFYFAIRMAPFLLLAPIGGLLADRFSKKRLLIKLDLLRIPFALSPIFVQGPSDLWIVYISTFCLSIGEALYAPTRMATIPSLVKQDKLLYINAIEQILVGVVLVLGSSTGGIISYLFGLQVSFILDACTFLFSALLLLPISIPATREVHDAKTKNPPQPISPWNLVIGSFALIIFITIEATMPLANGIDNVLMSVYALDVFHMGDLGVGFIRATLGLGFIISSFFSNMLKRKLVVLIVLFIALEGIGHILLSIAPSFIIALMTVLLITTVGGMSNICLSTLIMKIVPRTKQGAFFGFTQMISNTSLGISMGAAGFLLEVFTPRTLSLLVGITYVLFTILYATLFSRVNLIKEKIKLMRGQSPTTINW